MEITLEEERDLANDLIAYLYRSRSKILGELDVVNTEIQETVSRLNEIESQIEMQRDVLDAVSPTIIVTHTSTSESQS